MSTYVSKMISPTLRNHMPLVFVSRMYPHKTAPKNQWVVHIIWYFHEMALSLHIGTWKVNSSHTGTEAYSAEEAGNQWIQCVLGHRVHHPWKSSLNRSTGRFVIISGCSIAEWLVLLVNSFLTIVCYRSWWVNVCRTMSISIYLSQYVPLCCWGEMPLKNHYDLVIHLALRAKFSWNPSHFVCHR